VLIKSKNSLEIKVAASFPSPQEINRFLSVLVGNKILSLCKFVSPFNPDGDKSAVLNVEIINVSLILSKLG
jgi:hypothetical protein